MKLLEHNDEKRKRKFCIKGIILIFFFFYLKLASLVTGCFFVIINEEHASHISTGGTKAT